MNSVQKFVCGFVCLTAVSFTASAAGVLPEGYTEIEYIQGNGSNARIVTDYTPVPGKDKIEAEVEFPTLDTATIWCARGSTASTDTWSLFMSDNTFRFDYFNDTTRKVAGFTCAANKRYKVVAEGCKFDIYSDGSRSGGYEHSKVENFNAGGPVVLFASYYNGTDKNLGNWSKHKLYSFKVWRLGKLIHYFVPCKDSSGKGALVDLCDSPATLTVDGTFTAGGEGHFFEDSYFAHADQAGKLPTGCVALEYIETTSTGKSGSSGEGDQYILLDYTPTSNSVIETEVAMRTKDYNQSVFCTRGTDNNKKALSLFWIAANGTVPNDKGLRYDYDENTQFSGFDSITTEKHLLQCTPDGLSIDGAPAAGTKPNPHDFTVEGKGMMLFASYSKNRTESRGNYAKLRLYSFKAYDGGSATPAVDLVPCSNTTTHAVFLFDVANNRAYLNQGVTPFVGGRLGLFTVEPIADQELVVPMDLPKPVVRDCESGDVLVEGTHYTLSYSGAVNTFGTVEVSVTGVGDYEDSSVVTVRYRNLKVKTLNVNAFTFTMGITPAADKVSEPLTNFPVLVRLSAARQKRFDPSKCGTNGSDLRFALEDGTILSHEIDYWTTDGDCCVWVNVPSLTADTKIVACWGRHEGRSIPYVEPAETWPDFVGVWHFSEPGGSAKDSSGNGYDTTNETATVASTEAKIGLSRATDGKAFRTGVTDLLSAAGKKNISNVRWFTVSGWMYESTGESAGYRMLFKKYGSNNGWQVGTENNLTRIAVCGGNTARFFDLTYPINDRWTHFEIVYSGDINKAAFWVDGVKKDGAIMNTTASDHELMFLASLTGYGDELRIRNGTVSEAWAKADYQNQATDTFLSYGKVKSHDGLILFVR